MNASTKDRMQKTLATLVMVALVLCATGAATKLYHAAHSMIYGDTDVRTVDPSLLQKPYIQRNVPLMDSAALRNEASRLIGTPATNPGR